VLADASSDKNTPKYNWNLLKEMDNVDTVKDDVRNSDRLEELADGVDAIVHCAGQVAVTASLEDPREDFSTNAEGTFNVAEAARKSSTDPTVVFTSTNKVYGDNVNDIPVTLDGDRYRYDDPDFRNGIPEHLSIDDCEHTPYGTSKLAGDLYLQDYADRNEIDAAVFRMSCIYGTRQFGVEDQGWLAHFIISTLQDEGLTIYGDGKQVRDVLWVDDLVKAFDAFIQDPARTDEMVFNIGGGNENTLSLLELLDVLEEQTGQRTDIDFDEWREGDQKVYISDISRAKNELDWTPQVSPEEGVRRFLEWYRDHATRS
ncbi:MAG: NAD-dependent epimerase/dehydratase family protein, partial [Candidatus Nanohaloarchaea archaeon]|nr:NAD-dependent epimerase/dehydratase family protein [Candidatus Nanohaloarchaea archaeon]